MSTSPDPRQRDAREERNVMASLKAAAPYLLMVLPGIVWGGNAIVARAVVGELPPVGLAFWRWLIAALIVLPFAWPHLRRDIGPMLKSWPIVLLLAGMGIAFFNAALYIAAATTGAINIIMLQTSAPVLIVLATYLIFGDRISARQAVGIALSLVGAVVLVAHGDINVLANLAFNNGDIWMLVACIVYAVYTALLRLRPRVHWLSFLFTIFLMGSMLLLPFYIAESAYVMPVPLSLHALLAVGYVALFASAIGYGSYNRAVELLGANTAGLSIYLVPVFGTIFAILLLGEHPELYQLAGTLLIAGGIALAARRAA
ncbi:DMT family transporter [Hyphomicrobium sulfonivorans]|uniref:DMT family transporter n=1 Tax=Hyphomicrobium sulfonivorans TaxID=121290 RepID=UPI001FEB5558|nr:DMT family transporter [Hyphomicrobium sulfonivorans]